MGEVHAIPVFFSSRMVADSESASPSAAKPAKVVASWRRQFPITVIEPERVSIEDLARVHDRKFVLDILGCKRNNGFGNRSRAVADSLPYTSGAMVSAAVHALSTGGAAAAPCSGFHHAEYGKAQGYCTFNGLMVAASILKERGVKLVGILDLDMHNGNGTDDIIERLGAGSWVRHYTAGKVYTSPWQASEFFDIELPAILRWMADCDIVLYQAGADPHIDDPQGGWLTTEELRKRDAMVFDALARAKVPVAWNLAGGYQVDRDGGIPKVIQIHDNTMRECVRVHVGAAASRAV